MSEEAGERRLDREVGGDGGAGGPDAALAVRRDGVQSGVWVDVRWQVRSGNPLPRGTVPAFDCGQIPGIVEPDEFVADRPDLGRRNSDKVRRSDLDRAESRHQHMRPLRSVPMPGNWEQVQCCTGAAVPNRPHVIWPNGLDSQNLDKGVERMR